MVITTEQQQNILSEWVDIFGDIPETRQPGDMTAAEIAGTWKVDRIVVYKAVKQGKLKSVKVIDETTGKSITVYRINHDLDKRHNPDTESYRETSA